ncbi:MAG: hypothetical protein M1829_000580 [Trizodia sp. TS-e1964]|nr:MAG: hypothetical protein M1829_000580 [Trizodia sp. TS-e1964]
MARLNEPTGQTESVEALKRRFIRQNREIARSNSTQSVRIRSLEAETSRLLSENLSLRSEIITIRTQLDQDHSRNQLIADDVEAMKRKLRAKLVEINDILADEDLVPPFVDLSATLIDHITQRSSNSSMDYKVWKSPLRTADIASNQDGRLPPIYEDGLFPHQTLDPEDLSGTFRALEINNITPSPSAEEFPATYFHLSQATQRDPNRRKSRSSSMPDEIHSPDEPISLDCQNSQNPKDFYRKESRHTQLDGNLGTAPLTEPSLAVRTGAKRKLSARDDSSSAILLPPPPVAVLGKGSSPQNRTREDQLKANQESPVRPIEFKRAANSSQTVHENGVLGSFSAPFRRALGPKSVNLDPASPAKELRSAAAERTGIPSKDGTKMPAFKNGKRVIPSVGNNSTRGMRNIPKEINIPIDELLVVEPLNQADILASPMSSEPSNTHREVRDTPSPSTIPPSILMPESSRMTRRSRGNVNYAEPNLRDKMRRPTKALVDAVSGTRASSTKHEANINISVSSPPIDGRLVPEWTSLENEYLIAHQENSANLTLLDQKEANHSTFISENLKRAPQTNVETQILYCRKPEPTPIVTASNSAAKSDCPKSSKSVNQDELVLSEVSELKRLEERKGQKKFKNPRTKHPSNDSDLSPSRGVSSLPTKSASAAPLLDNNSVQADEHKERQQAPCNTSATTGRRRQTLTASPDCPVPIAGGLRKQRDPGKVGSYPSLRSAKGLQEADKNAKQIENVSECPAGARRRASMIL